MTEKLKNPAPEQAPAQTAPAKKRRVFSRGKKAASKAAEAAAPAETASKEPAKRSARSSSAKGKAPAARTRKEAAKTAAAPEKSPARKSRKKAAASTVRIIPLGGIGEIGKNCTVYECGDDMLVVDCGLSFPDENMLGVDIVIPDFTYLEKNKDRIRGIFITHGHEDHIGGLAYLLKQVNAPVYATLLTVGLIEGKLKEHNLLGRAKLNVVRPGDVIRAGCMSVEFIHVNHSIPDACAFAIHTPVGVIVQTGDFKVDYTPIQGGIIDLPRFGELGTQGVLALLPDSTNAENPGSTMSERTVGASFDRLFIKAGRRRIIIATFASNVHRIQQIIDYAYKYGKKIAVSGRSMVNVVEKALELGYLNLPGDIMIDIDQVSRYRDDQVVIITTGSQGEPMSALSRMASGDHRQVQITSRDFIIISARPIPGNEKLVGRVVNDLLKLGAEVIYEKMYEVHVSGHACQEDLKLMMALTRPQFVIPVHGEFKQLKKQKEIAMGLGVPEENILIPQLGHIMETDGTQFSFGGVVTAGQVLVDGLGVGDVGSIVLRDRKHLAQDGLIVVVVCMDTQTGAVTAGPDIISRGFVYVREAEELMQGARDVAVKALESCSEGGVREWGNLKQKLKDDISRYLYSKTKRSPMILPIIQEV